MLCVHFFITLDVFTTSKVLNSRCLIGGCRLFIYLIFFLNLKSHHSMVVYTEPDIKQSGQLCETPWGHCLSVSFGNLINCKLTGEFAALKYYINKGGPALLVHLVILHQNQI